MLLGYILEAIATTRKQPATRRRKAGELRASGQPKKALKKASFQAKIRDHGVTPPQKRDTVNVLSDFLPCSALFSTVSAGTCTNTSGRYNIYTIENLALKPDTFFVSKILSPDKENPKNAEIRT